MNYHVCDIHGLVLSVGCYDDVRKLEKLFDGGKYGRNQVLRMLCHLLDDFLALEEFMMHQLTVFFLKVSYHVRHGVVDGVGCAVENIRKIGLLGCGDYLLHEVLLNSRHFAKKKHFLGVCNFHVVILVVDCFVQDDDRIQMSWVNEGRF